MDYKIIYCDPPWSYTVGNKKGSLNGVAENHYSTMSLEDIKKLPVQKLGKDCVIFMWVTYPTMEQAFELLKSWGFKYKTVGFTWIKTYKNGNLVKGLGYWTRSNAELCLIGVKGNYPRRISKSVQQVIIQSRREHSRKPDLARRRIVELMGDLPRIELFARKKSELFEDETLLGWDFWGNQADSDITF